MPMIIKFTQTHGFYMIQLNRIFTPLFISVLGNLVCSAQPDLFSTEATLSYAQHLYKSGNYKTAALEFERVYAVDSSENSAFYALKSYRKAGQLDVGFKRFSALFGNMASVPTKFAEEYSHYLIYANRYHEALEYISEAENLKSDDKTALSSTAFLYLQNWDGADSSTSALPNDHPLKKPYERIAKDGAKIKKKSAALAGILSTAVPGLGRVYTGNWKDGLVSLVFVGTMTWQSYAGFNKNGIESGYGWVFGTLATGFFIGNIYGSAKAANTRNMKNQAILIGKIDEAYSAFY